MLNKVTLKNFRKHTDSEFEFGGGLNCLRGSNEAGKSTIFEAVAYAMFGSSALRDSVENVVTWGESVGSLKVELELSIDNVVYIVRRSKASAELTYDGGIVTNQKEVTAYLCRLLKMDAGAAARLTLSNQNEIRGALEAGTKATTELIERLAEFDQIDKLVELIQEKLTLGNTATAEAAISTTRESLDRARDLAVPFPDNALKAAIDIASASLAGAEAAIGDLEAADSQAQVALGATQALAQQRVDAIRVAAKAAGVVIDLKAKLVPLENLLAPDNVEGRVEVLRTQIADAANADAINAAYAKVSSSVIARKADIATYEGTVEALRADIAAGAKALGEDQLKHANLDGEVRLLRQALTHGSCTFCGKDFSGVPEVAEKNASTTRRIEEISAARHALSQKLVEQRSDVEAMQSIELASRPALALLAAHLAYVKLADGELPPMLSWIGPARVEVPNTAALRAQIAELQAQQRSYDADVVRCQQLGFQLLAAREADDEAQDALVALPPDAGDANAAELAVSQAKAALRSGQALVNTAREGLQAALRDRANAKSAFDRAVAAVTELEGSLAKREADLTTLEFNNALLKRVRQCRPILSDNLWNIVLAAVSAYFSEIRGVPSRVTKDGDGFKVDDHPVTSMSGSTLDALGLAVRVALVRTFLPSAPFLVLDEPAAAMDGDRTESMLGFLSSCGFTQILLTSHEEISERVADQVIVLGQT